MYMLYEFLPETCWERQRPDEDQPGDSAFLHEPPGHATPGCVEAQTLFRAFIYLWIPVFSGTKFTARGIRHQRQKNYR
jgi:hypothetical protein